MHTAENRHGPAPCGHSNQGPPAGSAAACFADTDYWMYIARTIQPHNHNPWEPMLCFHEIRFWVHPQTDSYSHGADDPAVLIQHDYDDRLPVGSQCPGVADQYRLVGTPQQTLKRSDIEFVVPNVPRQCDPPVHEDDYPGGQGLETCIVGIFERIVP